MEFQTVQGPLYYEVNGQGRPLLLIHGNGEDHSIFDRATELLAKRFQVYAIDSRGHGKSFPVKEYHYQDMAEDIRQFITGLSLEKPILCGFSDGGILGLLLSSQYPDLLGGVVACGVNTRPEGIKPGWLCLFRLMYFLNRSPLFKLMLTEPDITPKQLAAIRCPVLIAGGSKDMISRKHLEEIAEQIPGAQLRILPGEGHGSYIIGSEKIAKIVLEFCEQR
ncbi:MAG: alpha/beta hydrolase [Clostridiales bacterium]|nr:alpha/beta hydrolase [Clostridiales bacterium]